MFLSPFEYRQFSIEPVVKIEVNKIRRLNGISKLFYCLLLNLQSALNLLINMLRSIETKLQVNLIN